MENKNWDKFVYTEKDMSGITIVKSRKTIKHKFLDYNPEKATETLIIGTFNPDAEKNEANFFYSRKRNYLWQLLPTAFNESDLRKATKQDKEVFISRHKLAFIDLIQEVEVEVGQEINYADAYLDKQKLKWRELIKEIENLKKLKRICFTRTTFADIPNMNEKVNEIQKYCQEKNIKFQRLVTPARFYNSKKQAEWSKFLLND